MRTAGAAAAAFAVALAYAGCSDDARGGRSGDGPGGEQAATSAEAAETADVVCSMLRGWNNDISDVINATSRTVTDQDDADTAAGVLTSGFDELIQIAEQHRAAVDALDLPDVEGRDQLIDELAEGADESIEVLREERDQAAALGPVPVEDQAGALGGAFVGVERALSVIEPQIAAYSADLQQAFLTDEGCTHVIQPIHRRD